MRATPARAFVGLGSNLGDRMAHLSTAIQTLDRDPRVEVLAVSPVYEGPAHTLDGSEQPLYLNAVAALRTTLSPAELLDLFIRVEQAAGRERHNLWEPRFLDLDLLLYGDQVIWDDDLAVPHPRLAERQFVLRPLADLAPNLIVPSYGVSVEELLEQCPDTTALTELAQPLEVERSDLASGALDIPDTLRYIVVEGVIGAGKTSLARLLAERMGARLVLEEFEENPFLPDFYRDAERWAFHTQLAFLASRFRQQKELGARDLFHYATVADYTFDKDRIFAHITLDGDELQLYETLYGLMEPATPQPDLVVYLQSSVDRLMQNIAQRDRLYERTIERSYIAELAEAYDRYFRHYSKGPLLIVNSTAIDFVQEREDFERLVRQIAAMAGHSGTARFNPADGSQLDLL
jgi:2-amino-4-hydroxy-6-hydroxymethyldihydropteridine diphosphokinase